jgi:uncharacterized protein YggE
VKKSVLIPALCACVLLAAAAAAETFTFTIPDVYLKGGEAAKEPVLLNVTGTGRVKAVPDQVVISARIYTEAKRAGEAFDENQFRMGYLMDLLIAQGVPREKIATESLYINPVYKKDSSKVDYYVVDRRIKIFQDNMERISPVLDALVDSQVDEIGSIEFVVKDLDQKYEEALEEAAADARRTAKMLTAGLGAKVVGLKAMSYDYGGGGPVREMSRTAAFDMGAGMTGGYNQVIVPREVTTTVNVYATYELEYLAGE